MSREVIVALTAVIVALCMTVATLYFYFKDATLETIRVDAYKLFLKAENRFKTSGAGKEKMQWVFNTIREIMPSWVRIFVTDELLAELLQQWFNNVKDLLDDGKINKSAEV